MKTTFRTIIPLKLISVHKYFKFTELAYNLLILRSVRKTKSNLGVFPEKSAQVEKLMHSEEQRELLKDLWDELQDYLTRSNSLSSTLNRYEVSTLN